MKLMLHSLRSLLAKRRLEIAVVIAVGFLALSAHISGAPLVDWDEATYAEVAHEAVQNHDYLNLTWNGDAYLKKPPMLFWAMSLSNLTFGESETAARIPSVIFGTLTLLLLYFIGCAAGTRLTGIFAAAIPLGFYFFIARGGREAATDAPLLFFLTLSIFALIRARTVPRWMWLAGAACGFAVLSKGLAGAIAAIVAVAAVAMIPAFRGIGIGGLATFFASAAIVAAPWYLYQAIHYQSAFWSIFVAQETLARLSSHLEDHPHDFEFTARTLFHEVRWLWPIIPVAAALVFENVRAGARVALDRVQPDVAVWILWLAIALAAVASVQTRLPWYILPALLPIALLAAITLSSALTMRGESGPLSAAAAVAALIILLAHAPYRWAQIEEGFAQQRENSLPSYMIAMRARNLAREHSGAELYFAGIPLPTMVYYSGLRCHFVAPASGDNIEPVSDMPSAPRVSAKDAVLVTPEGEAITVSNYDQEWSIDMTERYPKRHAARHFDPKIPRNAIPERRVRDDHGGFRFFMETLVGRE